jgi:hypothetical protein
MFKKNAKRFRLVHVVPNRGIEHPVFSFVVGRFVVVSPRGSRPDDHAGNLQI